MKVKYLTILLIPMVGNKKEKLVAERSENQATLV